MRLEISKAVHPHMHAPGNIDSEGARGCDPPPISGGSGISRRIHRFARNVDCGRITRSRAYTSVVPYLSTTLVLVQAGLGVAATVATAFSGSSGYSHHIVEENDCRPLATAVVAGFHAGMALLFFASAVQTHLANAMCVKIFFIVALALGAHFGVLGLMAANGLVVGQTTAPETTTASTVVCSIDTILQQQQQQKQQGSNAAWLAYLPAYSAVSHFFFFFFSSISFINGASRLTAKRPGRDFISFRETVYVFLVFRGIGLMFIANVVGLMWSALAGVLAAVGRFQFFPLWIVQWAMVSRLLALALRSRGSLDPTAHLNGFWRSPEYVSSRICLPELTGPGGEKDCVSVVAIQPHNSSSGSNSSSFFALVSRLLLAGNRCQRPCCTSTTAVCHQFPHAGGAGSSGLRGCDRPLVAAGSQPNSAEHSIEQISIVVDAYPTRISRHDTVVGDDVHF
ncbi:hypothetical protein GGI11_000872 [Coemansia sp. RSA 2049]|nr:hypothetical protein GGI11_000872 [Coemansia sp. RSA 2049]